MSHHPVKWFSHLMQGAPIVTAGNTGDGSHLAMLKACLVTGFGQLQADSLVWDATAGRAKLSINAGHSYLTDSIVLIEGASDPLFNGEHRVMQANSTELWFDLDSQPSADPSGTISIKVAPAGWKIFDESPDGQIAIFEAADDEGDIYFLVDNSAYAGHNNTSSDPQVWMKLWMVENPLSWDAYDIVIQYGLPASHWYGSSAKEWDLVADSKLVYEFFNHGTYGRNSSAVFGYINSIRPGDRYHAIVSSRGLWQSGGSYSEWNGDDYFLGEFLTWNSTSGRTLARKHHQLPGVTAFKVPSITGRSGSGLPYPNPSDNGAYYEAQSLLILEADGTLRGSLPGLIHPYFSESYYKRRNFRGIAGFDGDLIRYLFGSYSQRSYDQETMVAFSIGDAGWR